MREHKILRRALVEAAAVDFPCTDLAALSHDILSFMHPAFHAASKRIGLSGKVTDVFEPARGVDSAVVLAGYGLPVAPYDLEPMCILAKPTNDIDAALALFSRDKTAFVGYDVCSAPLYLFMTNCCRTLRQRVLHDSEFSRSSSATAEPLYPLTPEEASNLPWVFFNDGRKIRFRASRWM